MCGLERVFSARIHKVWTYVKTQSEGSGETVEMRRLD